jgi:hypothetical protein
MNDQPIDLRPTSGDLPEVDLLAHADTCGCGAESCEACQYVRGIRDAYEWMAINRGDEAMIRDSINLVNGHKDFQHGWLADDDPWPVFLSTFRGGTTIDLATPYGGGFFVAVLV